MEDETVSAQSPQEVSGQAAFWILATLAVAAVTQPSTSSQKRDRTLFDGNIDLFRCIPAVCLLDAVVDLVILGGAIRGLFFIPQPAQQIRRHVLPAARILTVKLALSIFAVLPQTIKVFSLQGVPATQFCASLYFFAAVTKLVVDLCGLGADEHPPATQDSDGSMDFLVLFALFLQTPFEVCVWYNISLSAPVQLPTSVENFCAWSATICVFLIAPQIIIWISYCLVRWRFSVYNSPYMVPMRGLGLLLILLGAAKTPVVQEESGLVISSPPAWMNRMNHMAGLSLFFALLSIGMAKIMDALGKLIVRADESMPTTGAPTVSQSVESTSEQVDNADGQCNTETPVAKGLSGTWVGRLGVITDRWVLRVLTVNSTVGVGISLATFNLATSIFYYFLSFDGTGTVNPSWTSMLG
ncbi:hypothetical protein F66182_9945 [Fusarium sp. NRRL 66182]|nr:hypothetical protein F66182_9945 [Fusarium sp. NRRL 66182]